MRVRMTVIAAAMMTGRRARRDNDGGPALSDRVEFRRLDRPGQPAAVTSPIASLITPRAGTGRNGGIMSFTTNLTATIGVVIEATHSFPLFGVGSNVHPRAA